MATSLETRVMVLESKIKKLEDELAAYKTSVASTYQTKSASAAADSALQDSINSLSTTVADHTAKFTTVQLPSETQYYLKQQDIVGLKKIVAQAAALKSDVDRQMKALIAAWKSFKAQQNI